MAARNIEIEGVDKLLRTLDKTKDKAVKKAIRAGIRSGLTVVAKQVRREVTGASIRSHSDKAASRREIIRSLKKTVGTKLKQDQQKISRAKVGFGVGKKRLTEDAAEQNRKARKQAGRSGVGIGAQNVHWFVLGTKHMEPLLTDQEIPVRAMRAVKTQTINTIAAKHLQILEREVKRIRIR